MATWITHMMIVDNLLNRGIGLDKTGFAVGNIAPDCNIENEDWTQFTPPRNVTHFMTGKSKLTADYEGFYQKYIQDKSFSSKEEYAFFMGYYTHLITDVLFQSMVRDEKRVERCFERIKQNVEFYRKIKGYPQNYDTLKQVIGMDRSFYDIHVLEINYLKEHPDSAYNTVLRKIDTFPDYMDILPEGAIVRKIKVMAYEPREDTLEEFIFFDEKEYQNFILESSDFIYKILQKRCSIY